MVKSCSMTLMQLYMAIPVPPPGCVICVHAHTFSIFGNCLPSCHIFILLGNVLLERTQLDLSSAPY